MVIGGISDAEKQPSKGDRVLEIVPKLAPKIRTQVASKMTTGDSKVQEALKNAPVTVVAYKTQVVAGTNYFIKAKVDKYVFFLRIYDPLRGEPELSAVKGPVAETAPIEYFD